MICQHRHHEHDTNEKPQSLLCLTARFLVDARSDTRGVQDMLGLIAAVLIILWLLGFFAFHVTAGFIHIALIVGLVLLVFHFLRGRSATA
ncbi:MAG: lmo0937 family membrane protein [Candidatus Acidiferrales bacterium]